MVRRFHRSIYDELDELRASMDYLYQLALEPAENPLLLHEENPGIVCQYVHNLNPEVSVQDDEVTVTVDTVTGTGGNAKISLELVTDTTLRITGEYAGDEGREPDLNPACEKNRLSLHRVVLLPVPVTSHGARMSLVHGVLDLHLKKARAPEQEKP
nr:hypothetical protein [uncultured Methanoregula sp.]